VSDMKFPHTEQPRDQTGLYHALFANAPIGVMQLDPEGCLLQVNPVMLRLLGYEQNELLGRHFSELTHPRDIATSLQWQERVSRCELDRFSLEKRYLRKDGSSLWGRVTVVALRNSRGAVSDFIAMFEEIDRYKVIQADLSASHTLLDQAERMARLGHWLWDFGQDQPVWSREMYRIFGRDPALHPANYQEVARYFSSSDWKRLSEAVDRAVHRGIPYELDLELAREDGERCWVMTRGEPVRDADGTIVQLRGMVQDITERKRAERVLAEQEARYRAVIEASEDGFWMIDREGHLLAVNDAYVRRSGYSRDELLSMSIWDLEARESPVDVKEHIRTVVSQGSDLFETRHRTRQGLVWPVEVSAMHSPEAGGLFFAFLRDITERKLLERQIVEASTAEQERIGRDIHDGLGQQLTALGMLVRSIQQRLESSGQVGMAGELRELGGHLQAVLEEASAIARDLVPVDLDPEGLAEALAILIERVRQSSGIDCRFHYLGRVRVENSTVAMQLYRIAQEALHNAIRHGQPRRVELRLERDADGLLLSIRDDGVGIDPEPDRQGCLGLRTMRYRAGLIAARLDITRSSAGGTLVSCRVPFGVDGESV